jgi:glycosyltransferase involved in cell wall biosynthesis
MGEIKTIWIFNHYANTPKTGASLRHFFFGEELIKRGYSVTVFASNEIHTSQNSVDTYGKKYIEKTDEGVPFVFVKTRKYKGNGISRVLNIISFFTNLFPVTRKYIKEHGRPDVIIGSSVHPLSCVAGIKIAKKLKIPCIVEIRDLWPEAIFMYGVIKAQSIIGRLMISGEKWIYNHADAIIFTKEGDVDYIKEMKWDTGQGGRIDLDKCFYINNGVNIKKFMHDIESNKLDDPDLDDESFKVVYAGAIRPVNNVDNIIDAAKLLRDNPDIKFLIYGSGSEFERLKKRAAEEKLENVKLKGFVEKKYIPYILSKSSVNILNYSQSKYNWARGNSSNKLFEYMASGKPIISTVKMGYCILTKYNCGYSLSECTPEELAKTILQVYSLPRDQYDELSSNATKGAMDFDYTLLTDKLENVINAVMSRRMP